MALETDDFGQGEALVGGVEVDSGREWVGRRGKMSVRGMRDEREW